MVDNPDDIVLGLHCISEILCYMIAFKVGLKSAELIFVERKTEAVLITKPTIKYLAVMIYAVTFKQVQYVCDVIIR